MAALNTHPDRSHSHQDLHPGGKTALGQDFGLLFLCSSGALGQCYSFIYQSIHVRILLVSELSCSQVSIFSRSSQDPVR
jgi:hypothetical protein